MPDELEPEECPTCGEQNPQPTNRCPYCGTMKCIVCDMGNDVECPACDLETHKDF